MELIEELKDYAHLNKVPIIQDAGLEFLLDSIKKYKPKRILEVGTAIGYSAINMALCGSEVITIERDPEMYKLALENIHKAALDDKIKVVFSDAKEALPLISNLSFDLIFIDAAKGSYQTFFDLYTPLLNENGMVICDNLDFHGLCAKEDLSDCSRALRSMIRKLNKFKEELKNNAGYTTSFNHCGDGMSISFKK